MERKKIANLAYKYAGDYNKIKNGLLNDEIVKDYDIKESYITIVDSNYPDCLKELDDPPFILFYKGNINLLNMPKVAVVGSRILDFYSQNITIQLCNKLKKEYCLVSGLAKGIDSIVHICSIENGYTIGVIGSGLDTHYPYCNEDLYQKMMEKHLIISEYPSFVKVKKYHFPWRNRIIAALGEKLYVTSGKKRSGTMITVNYALELNRDIYCVPYALNDTLGQGCNMLIAQGANIILEEDID